MLDIVDYVDDNIQKKGINLNSLGFNEYAWRFSEAEKILEIATINEWLILGGDVYLIDENKVSITYDYWYYNFDDYKESIKKAKEYIEWHHNKLGDKYAYSFVIKE